MKLAGLRLLFAAVAACALAACATSIIPYRTEHRYRIFYSADPAFDFAAPLDAAAAQAKFVPKESVALTIKQFADEGFALAKIEQVPYSKGAAVFTFSRRVANAGAGRVEEPPYVAGVYEVQTPDGSIFYALYPETASYYAVHAIGPMNVVSARAEWDGIQLSWEENGQPRRAIPGDDERFMKFVAGSGAGAEARRVEEIHRYTPREYMELKFLRRLRPETLGVEQGW